jgi:small-conductance mechanosensitive channel
MDTVQDIPRQIQEWLKVVVKPDDGGVAPFLHAIGVVAAAYVVWLIARGVLSRLQQRARHRIFVEEHPQLFDSLRQTVKIGIAALAGTLLLQHWQAAALERVFQATLILLLSTPTKTLLVVLIAYLEENLADKTDTRLDNIVFELLGRFAGVIIYFTAAVLALDILGINVMPFIAGAGVAGVAIGFAAKDTLSNLIAGILLIIDRPFEVGDRIEIWSAPKNSATWGDVIDIGLRATKIRTTDNIVIIIPNNEIMLRDIVNYTAMDDQMIRVRINIGVAYDAPIDKAKAAIIDIARRLPWAATEPPPAVVVRNFGESSVDLQLRVWITDARKRIHTISAVTDQVKAAFDAAGIEIPFPKRDITIISKPAPDSTSPAEGPAPPVGPSQ